MNETVTRVDKPWGYEIHWANQFLKTHSRRQAISLPQSGDRPGIDQHEQCDRAEHPTQRRMENHLHSAKISSLHRLIETKATWQQEREAGQPP